MSSSSKWFEHGEIQPRQRASEPLQDQDEIHTMLKCLHRSQYSDSTPCKKIYRDFHLSTSQILANALSKPIDPSATRNSAVEKIQNAARLYVSPDAS
jgi:hypothetical protein